jgi:hypothetical protein
MHLVFYHATHFLHAPFIGCSPLRTFKAPGSLDAVIIHVMTAGVGWLILRSLKLFKRQQKTLKLVSGESKKQETKIENKNVQVSQPNFIYNIVAV